MPLTKAHIFLVTLFVCVTSSSFAQTTAFSGRVTGILDGDTIAIQGPRNKEYKIRLAGIDAPEAGQDFADKAKEYLGELINGKTVTVVGRRLDRYGRIVAQVFLPEAQTDIPRDISYSMITAGLAWHYKEFAAEQLREDQMRYTDGEDAARTAGIHIWSVPNPVAPWQFMKASLAAETEGDIVVDVIGNRSSKIYHLNPGCPDFFKVAAKNKVQFKTKEEAEAAGYRAARNCRP
jgi:endonuclease YncB( thermonuclease family)